MTDTNRRFSWRQGDALTVEAASALNIQFLDNSGSTVAVVISHNCDLAAAADKEPKSEIIVGKRIDKLGGDSFGKTARRLHIEYQSAHGPIALELIATDKQHISKSELFESDPRQDIWLDGRGVAILQRWLAARYHRAAFPEEFERRLQNANVPGKRTFLKKLESILTDGGEHIRSLLFDLDDGKDIERNSSEDIYQLGIIVLYDSLRDEPTAAAVAANAAIELEELFDIAFHSPDAGWRNIRLKYCDPISDSAITVAQRELLKQWRLEHMSLKDDHPQPMISN